MSCAAALAPKSSAEKAKATRPDALKPPNRCSSGAQPLPSFLQAKFTVGAVDDPLELEADRVAEKVMRTPDGCCASCAGGLACEGERLQRKPYLGASVSHNGTSQAPPSVSSALRDSGAPLVPLARAPMERALSHSFSDVRIHTDTVAARSAADIGAEAYTIGRDVVFASGRYAPETSSGRRLLAHELVHVAQQRSEPIIRRQARGSCAGKGPFNCNGTTCRTPAGRAGTCMWISATRSCFCRDNSTDEPAPASKLIPSWLMALLGAAAIAAIIACFASGVCEFGLVIAGLGAAAAAAVLFLLRQAGITDSGSSGGPVASAAGETGETGETSATGETAASQVA